MAHRAAGGLIMQRSIDPHLFDWPSADPRLIGSRCTDCGVVSFPQQTNCPRCCGDNVERKPLGVAGRLWTWTTQEFLPKAPYAAARRPEEFEPFKVGYVELPGEVLVESRIVVPDDQALVIGMPMRLTFESLFTDAAGDEVISFAFVPVEERA
jgi:uncharacterized OB-fold protein